MRSKSDKTRHTNSTAHVLHWNQLDLLPEKKINLESWVLLLKANNQNHSERNECTLNVVVKCIKSEQVSNERSASPPEASCAFRVWGEYH